MVAVWKLLALATACTASPNVYCFDQGKTRTCWAENPTPYDDEPTAPITPAPTSTTSSTVDSAPMTPIAAAAVNLQRARVLCDDINALVAMKNNTDLARANYGAGSSSLPDTSLQNIINYINSTLEINIRLGLQSLDGRKASHLAQSLGGFFKQYLQGISNSTVGMGNALLGRTTSAPHRTNLTKVLNLVYGDYSSAIAGWS